MRRQGTRRGLAVLLGAAAGLLLAAPASAATQNGITYFDFPHSLPAGTHSGGSAIACSAQQSPLGVGIIHNGGSDVLLTRTGFSDTFGGDPNPDSAIALYHSTSVLAKEYDVSVICDETAPKYVSEIADVPFQQRTTATAYCPPKRHVYGGGVRGDGSENLQLGSSYPVDSKADRDKKPDDGWRGSLDNQDSGTILDLEITAACGKELPSYKSADVEIPGAGFLEQNVTCPATKTNVIAGGQKVSKAYNAVNTSLSYNYTASALYDSWDAGAYNIALGPASLTVFAVCIGDQLDP